MFNVAQVLSDGNTSNDNNINYNNNNNVNNVNNNFDSGSTRPECTHMEDKLQDLFKGSNIDTHDRKGVKEILSIISNAKPEDLETFKRYKEICQDSPNFSSFAGDASPLKLAEEPENPDEPDEPEEPEDIGDDLDYKPGNGKSQPKVTHHEESYSQTTVGGDAASPDDYRIHRSGNAYKKSSSSSHSQTIVESEGDDDDDDDDDDDSNDNENDDDDEEDDSSQSSSILVEEPVFKPVVEQIPRIDPEIAASPIESIEPREPIAPIAPIAPIKPIKPIKPIEPFKELAPKEEIVAPSIEQEPESTDNNKCEETRIELDQTLAREHHALEMLEEAKKTIVSLQNELANMKANADFEPEEVAAPEPVPCTPTIVEVPAPVEKASKTVCDNGDEIIEDPAERAAIFRKRIDVNDGIETQCAKLKLIIDHPDAKKKSVIKTIARANLEGMINQIEVDDDFLEQAKEFALALPNDNKKAQQVSKLIAKCFPDIQIDVLGKKKAVHSYHSFSERNLPHGMHQTTSYHRASTDPQFVQQAQPMPIMPMQPTPPTMPTMPAIPTIPAMPKMPEFQDMPDMAEMPQFSRSMSLTPRDQHEQIRKPERHAQRPVLQRVSSMPSRPVTPQMPQMPKMPKMQPFGRQATFSRSFSSRSNGFDEQPDMPDMPDMDDMQDNFESSINNKEAQFRSKFL